MRGSLEEVPARRWWRSSAMSDLPLRRQGLATNGLGHNPTPRCCSEPWCPRLGRLEEFVARGDPVGRVLGQGVLRVEIKPMLRDGTALALELSKSNHESAMRLHLLERQKCKNSFVRHGRHGRPRGDDDSGEMTENRTLSERTRKSLSILQSTYINSVSLKQQLHICNCFNHR